MIVEQIYTGCLAHGAYYIESNGESAIIDPLREVQQYIDLAEEKGTQIKYVFETHFHADFVSGHIDLAKKTGATIVIGPTQMETGYDVLIANDNQEFKIGYITIRVLHTPGHTLESSCFLLIDKDGKERDIFTGDTLFIGDVGRPDLAQKVIEDLTPEKLASHMYDSIHNRLLPLDDSITVYPGHGQGSACGKMMSKETSDSLGNQKKTNYALNPKLTREEFIAQILDGLTPPPGYFPHNVLMNIQGYEGVDGVIDKATKELSAEAFSTLVDQEDVVILDARKPDVFSNEFVPGSVNIGINGDFAVWVGTILKDTKQKIAFVAEEGKEKEVAIRLARIGFDNALGFLKGGVEAWREAGFETDNIASVTVDEMLEIFSADSDQIIDVRRKSEFDSEHIEGVSNLPLDYFYNSIKDLRNKERTFIHCAGGYRSMIFASLAKRKGFDKLVNVKGGFKMIKESGQFKLTEYVCPKTLL